jgi:uncharacterized protein (DUF2164 family)
MRGQPPITLADPARKQAIAALREYFAAEMDEPIGDLKAGLLLDFILKELGPSVYNQAIADARAFFEERSNDLAAVFHRDEFASTITKPDQKK